MVIKLRSLFDQILKIQNFQNLAINWLLIFLGLLFYNGLTSLALILVARQVNAEEYGQYVACYTLLSFLVIIPGFGLDAWLLTQPRDSKTSSIILWKNASDVNIKLLLAWILCMLFLNQILPKETYPTKIFIPTIFSIAFDSLLLLSVSSLRTQNKHLIVLIIQTIAGSMLFLGALMLPQSSDFVADFALYRCLLSFILIVLTYLFLARDYLSAQNDDNRFDPFRILKFARPFLFAEIASAVYVRSDIIIISFLVGSRGTGIYGPAITLLQASFLLPKAFFFFIVPKLSTCFQRKDEEKFIQLGTYNILFQGGIGFGMTIFLFLFSSDLITLLFNETYKLSALILIVLSPVPLLRSLNFAFGAILASYDKQKYRTRVQVNVAIINVIFTFVLVSIWGVTGAAIVYVFSELLLLLGYIFLVKNIFYGTVGISPNNQ